MAKIALVSYKKNIGIYYDIRDVTPHGFKGQIPLTGRGYAVPSQDSSSFFHGEGLGAVMRYQPRKNDFFDKLRPAWTAGLSFNYGCCLYAFPVT